MSNAPEQEKEPEPLDEESAEAETRGGDRPELWKYTEWDVELPEEPQP
jgi:hypothetical protein